MDVTRHVRWFRLGFLRIGKKQIIYIICCDEFDAVARLLACCFVFCLPRFDDFDEDVKCEFKKKNEFYLGSWILRLQKMRQKKRWCVSCWFEWCSLLIQSLIERVESGEWFGLIIMFNVIALLVSLSLTTFLLFVSVIIRDPTMCSSCICYFLWMHDWFPVVLLLTVKRLIIKEVFSLLQVGLDVEFWEYLVLLYFCTWYCVFFCKFPVHHRDEKRCEDSFFFFTFLNFYR